jgi:twitching motility protein PilT
MNKPVYEIPVTGPDFGGYGSTGAASYPPPVAAPVLEPTPGEYPEPGSFLPSTAAFGAPVGGAPVGGTFGFPPPADAEGAYVAVPTASTFPPPPTADTFAPSVPPAFSAPPPTEAPLAFDAKFSAPTFEAPTFEAPTNAAPTYEAPTYEVPAFEPPAYSAPSTAAPLYAVPPAAGPARDEPFSFGAPTGAHVQISEPTFEPEPIVVAETPEETAWVDPSYNDEAAKAARALADPDLLAALMDVVLLGASDLHVSSNSFPMIRVDGGLKPIDNSVIWDRDRVEAAIRSILTDAQYATFEENLELDLAYTISANARFRVNIYQQRGNMGAAFRLIPTGIKKLSELGLPDSIARFATLARGLVLVTGPTGSGKSTTLAAIIDLVNRTRADHIVTVEDPIEFLHSNQKSMVNQREVGADTHSFANALKHVLRQDPDVILIGELRDLETISVALTAAETGHLVFATLHTQDAPQTIDRVIDVFPPHQQGQVRAQLAATLQGVVCQTLVKKASGKGRAVATEVLIATPAINNLIREGKTYQIASAMQAGREHGMHTMDSYLADLVNSGEITTQAAMEKAQDVESIKQLIHRQETPTDVAARAMATLGIDFGDAYSTKEI